ncbi:hypothetical protein A3J11_02405 [Candidatus Kaiserbacteria bacterium RIFCSPLOWO2_02_FULL_55_12]|uniref:YCII-related domain-containing protein n=2 Tax=Candidatus Kaiseribacteriota TaxID=1752734 RepID=A0A1F6EYX4_9BACT|nr:MAG: hypothetical protein A3C94_01200 [Candidatus Kaiserbacteria bacterium RIFCSPHIGHO2_02_FULL_55_17]OGG78821.1 MAG: hypothetical protein A3J11_02405 [Candidatus Kaiserbacteria bacterium RIFCSPLOWO2_02_FULL_55_12]
MKKFMALYMAPVAEFERLMSMPPEQQGADMEKWTQWMKKNERSFIDAGAPLGKTKRITTKGVSDVKNEIGGYSIVQAESAADAAKLFEQSPHFTMASNAWIEVIECMPMPTM